MTNIGIERSEVPVAIPEVTLGWRMQMALDHADVAVAEMAVKLGVSRSTISRWLHDDWKKRPPRRPDLIEWARVCRVPFGWLVGSPLTGDSVNSDGTEPTDGYMGLELASSRTSLAPSSNNRPILAIVTR